ncbi:unnamed protein product [Chrysoparadoxa australica]
MERSNNSVFKLLSNIHFVQWVNHPTDESTHFWAKWIANHPESREDVAIAKRIILSAQLTSDEPISDIAYDRILENVLHHSLGAKKSQTRIGIQTWKFLGIAASILLILGFAFYGISLDPPVKDLNPITTIHKQAPLGSRVTTKLPDGSIVTLNSGSQITFPSEFEHDNREVKLTGEAFFEVVRNPEKPFYVKMNGNQVQVLGTSFNVRSYPQDDQVKVSVATGLVSYTAPSGEKVILSKDEEAVYSNKEGKLNKSTVKRIQAFGWKDKILFFDSMPFDEIILELERWYGVKVKVEVDGNPGNRGPYSGEFYNASLEEVLNGLSFVYRFNYSIKGNQVMLNNIN